jgi:glycosyltransferase involved in cell wall biosynthesis
LQQSHAKVKCLVIDDGSKDDTFDVATRLAGEDSRVRVLCHPGHSNRGTAASRNLGLRNAKGEFFAFLDSDDAWLPDKLERQLAILDARPEVGFVFGDVYLSVNPDPSRPMASQPLGREPRRAAVADMFNADPWAAARIMNLEMAPSELIPSPTPLVRRTLFEDGLEFVGPPRLSLMYEDFLMWRVLSMRTQFACIQEPLAIYRVHDASFTGQFKHGHSVVDHLIGLEEVDALFLDSCVRSIDGEWIRILHENQRTRITSGAHRAPWADIPRLMRLGRKYGVANEVLRRRIRKSYFNARSRLYQVKQRLLAR